MVLAHGGSVVHGVERRHLVDAHGGHFEQASDLVHDADGGEAVLALSEVEDGHDGGLLVLRGVALEDLGDDGLILSVELEGNIGVVVGRVAVLQPGTRLTSRGPPSRAASMRRPIGPQLARHWGVLLTTMRVSLVRRAVTDRARVWQKGAREAVRKADRKRKGVILVAIVSVSSLGAGSGVCNGSSRGGGLSRSWSLAFKLSSTSLPAVLELLAKCAPLIGFVG